MALSAALKGLLLSLAPIHQLTRFAAATFLLALASAGFSQEKRTVVLWGINMGPDTKGQEAVIREFERRHREIRIRVLNMGGRMDPQKLMTSIVGNVAPDIIHQDRFTIADWASRGAFSPLDDWIARDKDSDPLCPRPEQYYEAPWREASYNGKVYAVPTSADNRILFWNRGLFRAKEAELRAVGLDPERPPRTWSETLAYSKILTEFNKDGTIKRAGFLPNFGNAWLYLYAFQMNAEFMSTDGRTCTMATPEAAEALDFMVRGYDLVGGYERARTFESGFLSKENDAFIIGKVAMKIDGDWILADLARYGPSLDLGVAPPPVPDDRYNKVGRFKDEKDTYVTWFGGFSYAIPKGARNPEDAWTFLKFVTSTEGRVLEARAQRDWERMRGRIYIPRQVGSREANEELVRTFRPADKKFADAIDMHRKMAAFGKVRPATFAGQTLWSEHTRAMEAAVYKKSTPMEALKESQAVVQRELDAFFTKEDYPIIDLSVLPMIFGGLVLGGVIAAVIGFRKLKLGALARHEAKWGYLFIAPWVIGFVLLTAGPMLASLFFSFTRYDVLNEARWVGINNYADMVGADRPNFTKALFNALYLAGIGVPLSVFTGLAVALLLNAAVSGMRFYRTLFYMPAIVPGTASAVLWTVVLNPDPNRGLINAFWSKTITAWFQLPPPGWLQSANWSKDALIMMGLWGAGSGMILWLAGLKGVPSSLYEAASIDGAQPWRQFWSVTFPQLTPIVFFNVVMGFIGSIQEFDRMFIMKPSGDGPIGPDDSMLSPVYLLFKNGFAFFKMGYASALAWVIFAIIVALTFIQFKLAPRWVHYEAEKT